MCKALAQLIMNAQRIFMQETERKLEAKRQAYRTYEYDDT